MFAAIIRDAVGRLAPLPSTALRRLQGWNDVVAFDPARHEVAG